MLEEPIEHDVCLRSENLFAFRDLSERTAHHPEANFIVWNMFQIKHRLTIFHSASEIQYLN